LYLQLIVSHLQFVAIDFTLSGARASTHKHTQKCNVFTFKNTVGIIIDKKGYKLLSS